MSTITLLRKGLASLLACCLAFTTALAGTDDALGRNCPGLRGTHRASRRARHSRRARRLLHRLRRHGRLRQNDEPPFAIDAPLAPSAMTNHGTNLVIVYINRMQRGISEFEETNLDSSWSKSDQTVDDECNEILPGEEDTDAVLPVDIDKGDYGQFVDTDNFDYSQFVDADNVDYSQFVNDDECDADDKFDDNKFDDDGCDDFQDDDDDEMTAEERAYQLELARMEHERAMRALELREQRRAAAQERRQQERTERQQLLLEQQRLAAEHDRASQQLAAEEAERERQAQLERERLALQAATERDQAALEREQAAFEREQRANELALEREQRANELSLEREQRANEFALERERLDFERWKIRTEVAREDRREEREYQFAVSERRSRERAERTQAILQMCMTLPLLMMGMQNQCNRRYVPRRYYQNQNAFDGNYVAFDNSDGWYSQPGQYQYDNGGTYYQGHLDQQYEYAVQQQSVPVYDNWGSKTVAVDGPSIGLIGVKGVK